MQREFYQKTKTGKIRKISLSLDGNEIKTSWGFTDSSLSPQETTDIVKEAFYIGHAAYRSPEEQARIEFIRKSDKLIKEGNKSTYEDAVNSNPLVDLELNPLSTAFRPPKPISKKPCLDPNDEKKMNLPNKEIQKLIDSGKLVCQKKYNGIRTFVVKADGKFKAYSIRCKDATGNYPWLIEWFENYASDIPDDSMLDMEVIAGEGETIQEFRIINAIAPNTKPETAVKLAREYLQNNQQSSLGAIIFNVIFWGGANQLNLPYSDRQDTIRDLIRRAQEHEMVSSATRGVNVSMPVQFKSLNEAQTAMINGKWEGLVLYDLTATSQYSLGGKYYRPKGVYKWKNRETDEFVVLDVREGSGANCGVASSLMLGQYDHETGLMINCGCVGSGISDKMIEDGLESLIGKVVEIQYVARYDKSTATGLPTLQHPIFIRVREDKEPQECIYQEKEE